MQSTRLAFDPLWQCLCPSWATATFHTTARRLPRPRPSPQCLKTPRRRAYTAKAYWEERPPNVRRLEAASRQHDLVFNPQDDDPARAYRQRRPAWHSEEERARRREPDPATRTTKSLYNDLRIYAMEGKHDKAVQLVQYLVRERREEPNTELYHSLILANVSFNEGAAWRVHDLLEEMQKEGLQPDVGICHAVLKVLAVHPDHLLRTDVLEFMRSQWISVSEDGMHDIAAGLLKEGLFEQALETLDQIRQQGSKVEAWLLDLYVYTLGEAGEIESAYSILRSRHLSGELNISKTLWHTLLDVASSMNNMGATRFVWKTQVTPGYLNPNSGTSLTVLQTASRAGDAALATDVFAHLAKRGETFTALHYQLLLSAYLSNSPPDLKRAFSVLTIMASENLAPAQETTRHLFTLLRRSPHRTSLALQHLRTLHAENRLIPIAALNLVIEAYVAQKNLKAAMDVYKLIHTFAPITEGPKPTFANIDTFNLLLRGCRTASPPDAEQASFLVSELLALRVKPTALTYDRLILVFVAAGEHYLRLSQNEPDTAKAEAKGKQLIDYAYRHFSDMQPLGWMPRFGTVEDLSRTLASVGDERCWDVLQAAEDAGEEVIEGWKDKGRWARKNTEEAWGRAQKGGSDEVNFSKDVVKDHVSESEQVVASASSGLA